MKKRLYIAYGSNLNVEQMSHRCPTARLYGTGAIENYELQFKGRPKGAFATIGPQAGRQVPVAVWELQPRDEAALDLYEGVPNHYFKEDIPVTVDGQALTAMAYIMNPKMQFGVPSRHYFTTIYEGYEDCGLDKSVLMEAVNDSVERYHERAKRECQSSFWEENPESEPSYEDDDSVDPMEDPDEQDDGFGCQMHL